MIAKDKDVQTFLIKIESVKNKNNGGCLFYCYAFYKFLEKNNFDKQSFKIVQYAYEQDQIDQNLRFISNLENEPVSSYHFTWYYNDIEYDSEGVLKQKPNINREVLGIELCDIERFCESALLFADWNYMFNRKEGVDNLRNKLEIDLSHLL